MKKIASLLMLLISFAAPVGAEQVLVFAAASLKEPLDEIAGEGVAVSYGGSGTLARQVIAGAPADVVILANTAWMDVLVDGGHVLPETRVDLLGNRLVLLSGDPAPVALTQEGLGDGRIAMGFVASVPAGIYGKAGFEHLGLWDAVASQIVEVDNVRAAVVLVARGELPLAVGYATDAKLVDDVFAVAAFPPESHPPIRYVAAATSADGLAFLAELQSAQAQQVFVDAGFFPVHTQ